MPNENNNPLMEFMNQIINNRMYEVLNEHAEETGDKQFQKMIESMKIIAEKHNMEFTELFFILTEIAVLLQMEE